MSCCDCQNPKLQEYALQTWAVEKKTKKKEEMLYDSVKGTISNHHSASAHHSNRIMGNNIKDCMSPAYSEILFTLKEAILFQFISILWHVIYFCACNTLWRGKKRATVGVGRELFALLWPFHPTVSRMKCGVDSLLPMEGNRTWIGIFNILTLRSKWLLRYWIFEHQVSW